MDERVEGAEKEEVDDANICSVNRTYARTDKEKGSWIKVCKKFTSTAQAKSSRQKAPTVKASKSNHLRL
jgi:hypothetical protein